MALQSLTDKLASISKIANTAAYKAAKEPDAAMKIMTSLVPGRDDGYPEKRRICLHGEVLPQFNIFLKK